MLVRFVSKRFPELTALAQQRSLLLTNDEALQAVFDKLFEVRQSEDARQILLAVEATTEPSA